MFSQERGRETKGLLTATELHSWTWLREAMTMHDGRNSGGGGDMYVGRLQGLKGTISLPTQNFGSWKFLPCPSILYLRKLFLSWKCPLCNNTISDSKCDITFHSIKSYFRPL